MNIEENVLDPIEKNLSPDIFIDGKEIVKEKVKHYLIDTFLRWFIKMGYDKKNVKSIYIIGSSVGYQYTEVSDLDVSVEVDLEPEVVKKTWPLLPNGNTIPDTKHPVNYYLTTDKSDVGKADSAYDLLSDKWLKKPSKEKLSIPLSYATSIAKFFTTGLQDRLADYEQNKYELELYKNYSPKEEKIDKSDLDKLIADKEIDIKADLDALKIAQHLIKAFRKEAFAKEDGFEISIDINIKNPNFSINNIIYKLLESYGYMDKIQKIFSIEDKKEESLDKKS
jgi:hypothetical protein